MANLRRVVSSRLKKDRLVHFGGHTGWYQLRSLFKIVCGCHEALLDRLNIVMIAELRQSHIFVKLLFSVNWFI